MLSCYRINFMIANSSRPGVKFHPDSDHTTVGEKTVLGSPGHWVRCCERGRASLQPGQPSARGVRPPSLASAARSRRLAYTGLAAQWLKGDLIQLAELAEKEPSR